MSDGVWQARPLAPAELAAHLKRIESYAALEVRLKRDYTRLGLWVAAGASTVAMAAVAGMVYVHIHQPLPPPPRFIEVHDNGFVGVSMGASEAPRLFSERTAERYLHDYVTACLSYVPDTYQITVHQCAVMSAPEQQERLAAQIAAKNPNAAVNVYGAHGYAMPYDFHFQKQGQGKFRTLKYVVRFQMVEKLNNRSVTRWWTAQTDFQWHPELPMGDQDRLLDEAGMQVLTFNAYPDPGQPQ